MTKKIAGLFVVVFLSACGFGRADFKYTEQSKITGGAMAGVMKFAGVFSKKARAPMASTTYVKGNRMRLDSADGNTQIIDLDGRRIINIDNPKRTYSVLTFDQMRQAMEQARARLDEEEKKQAKQGKNPNVKITPKFRIEPGAGSRVILGQNTHEMKTTVEMEMQSDDPQTKGQTATFSMSSDEYIAPSVSGYQEMQNFRVKMAQELDWLPGMVFGGNAQMSSLKVEAAKHADELKGFPLLTYSSFGGAGSGTPNAQSGSQAQPSRSSNSASDNQSSNSSSVGGPSEAAAKALGSALGGLGGFGGFGRHRKKKSSDEQSAQNQGGEQQSQTAQAPPSTPGSLMEMTTEVTSYSDSALDPSLFEIPSGYQQLQADLNRTMR